MEGRKAKRFLSEEEIALWAHVTRHDEPMAGTRHDFQNGARLQGIPAKTPAPRIGPRDTKSASEGPARKPAPSPAPVSTSPAAPPPHASFDPRVSKRIARGRHAIDARLDLHGLRQHDAYVALRRFLAHCQADGLRHVLIITGKGGKTQDAEAGDFWRTEERGVLRRLVPQWLAEPSFRLHVVSFTESAANHGGSGALYVTIRKGPRHPRG